MWKVCEKYFHKKVLHYLDIILSKSVRQFIEELSPYKKAVQYMHWTVLNSLPLCYECIVNMLPMWCNFAANILLLCWKHIAIELPMCYLCVTNAVLPIVIVLRLQCQCMELHLRYVHASAYHDLCINKIISTNVALFYNNTCGPSSLFTV